MCGVYFYYSADPITGELKRVIVDNFNKTKHRGPDASRIRYYNSNVMMGFHRLAIVDPTGDGMQPFEDERFSCIVNGEIYNHRKLQEIFNFPLKSHSDCEVVLHIFKNIIEKDFDEVKLEHLQQLCSILDGEFAFIIYDTKTGASYFGVDELRARPLFLGTSYNKCNNWNLENAGDNKITNYCLASEQKSIIGMYTKPIAAGTVGFVANGHMETLKYSDLYKHTIKDCTFEFATNQLRELMIENVANKLNPDREFCFLLSGGLDSSLICGIAAKILAPSRIKTFTVGFSENASDIIASRKVAKHIDSIHTEFIFTYEDGLALLPDVIKFNESWDQTTTRASIPMMLACRAIKKKHPEMAVIYSGEISDELLMGYLEWQSAPNETEAREHVMKRLTNITYFDGLRADRMITSVGCELRLPFFSKSLLNFVLSLPPQYLMPQHNNKIEKFLLRSAFDNLPIQYIPNEILWRTKHAFSDATSLVGEFSFKEFLKKHADREITNSRFEAKNILYEYNTPQTKEDMLYREIFSEFGYEEQTIPFKWLPNWSPEGLTDSSATALTIFRESI